MIYTTTDHSWFLLSAEARAVFAKLAIFRGGFCREAAEYVADATPAILSLLVDASFLRLTTAGRYVLHELLRQYGTTKLSEAAGAAEQTCDRHSRYYAEFMRHRATWLVGGHQKQGLTEIGVEIENVRNGWMWAVEYGLLQTIDDYFEALWRYYALRGLFQEAVEAFGSAAEHLSGITGSLPDEVLKQRVRAALITSQGLFYAHIGRSSTGKILVQKGLATLRQLAGWKDMIYPLSMLGYLLVQIGEYTHSHKCLIECLAISEKLDDRWGIATALTNLGIRSYAVDEFATAQLLLERGLAAYRANNDLRGTGSALVFVGALNMSLERYNEAERALHESLRISRDMDDQFMMVLALLYLGHVSARKQADVQAQRYFCEALKIGMEIRLIPWVLDVIAGFAALVDRGGSHEQALELFAFVLRHPGCQEETKKRFRELVATLEAQLPAHAIVLAWEIGPMRTIEDVAAELLEMREVSESITHEDMISR